MEWVTFLSGFLSASFAFALLNRNEQLEPAEVMEDDSGHDDVEINDFKDRTVKMACATCRKLKTHREVEPNLYQCTKCKRHVDLRASR